MMLDARMMKRTVYPMHDEHLQQRIKDLVGDIVPEQMRDVESFVGENIGVFIPSTGYCKYSISENHIHPSYSFCYSFDKNIRISIHGATVDAQCGTVYFIPPDLPHHEITGESFTRYVAVLIEKEFFETHASIYGGAELLLSPRGFPVNDPIRLMVRDFMIEMSEKPAGWETMLHSLEINLCHQLLRSFFGIVVNGQKVSSRMDIDHVIEYINVQYANQITVEDMSSVIALSSSHFSRLFKKETGMSPQEYLIDVRLNRARSYLLKSDKNLTEIAHDCGFASSAHFSSSFRRRYGQPPSALRRNI
jgi:AraC-like DNA-binding protein